MEQYFLMDAVSRLPSLKYFKIKIKHIMELNLFLMFCVKAAALKQRLEKQLKTTAAPLILLRLLFHVIVCLHHFYVAAYSISIDVTKITEPVVLNMIKYAPIYFTSWNFVAQSTYFILSTMYDTMNLLSVFPDKQKKLNNWLSYLYSGIAFPYSIYVFSMFWGLYTLEPEYVFPKACEESFPKWLNHSMHTWTLFFIIVEACIVFRPPETLKSAFRGYNIVFFGYHSVFILSRFLIGHWIYPVFNLMTRFQVFMFMIAYYIYICSVVVMGVQIERIKYKYIERNRVLTKEL